MTRRWLVGLAFVALGSSTAWTAVPLVVTQARRAFSTRELRVSRGDTVRFNNVDDFMHQIVVDGPGFKFSSNEQQPGQAVDVMFPVKGVFEVRCEIHPKMVMSVTVE